MRNTRDVNILTWNEFQELFKSKYVSSTFRQVKREEFEKLIQREMSVLEYEAKFVELSRYAGGLVATEEEKSG